MSPPPKASPESKNAPPETKERVMEQSEFTRNFQALRDHAEKNEPPKKSENRFDLANDSKLDGDLLKMYEKLFDDKKVVATIFSIQSKVARVAFLSNEYVYSLSNEDAPWIDRHNYLFTEVGDPVRSTHLRLARALGETNKSMGGHLRVDILLLLESLYEQYEKYNEKWEGICRVEARKNLKSLKHHITETRDN